MTTRNIAPPRRRIPSAGSQREAEARYIREARELQARLRAEFYEKDRARKS